MSVLSFPATQQQCIYLIQKTAERTIYSSKLKEILYEIMFDVPLQSSDSETKKKKKITNYWSHNRTIIGRNTLTRIEKIKTKR